MGQLPEYFGGTSRYRGLILVRAFAFLRLKYGVPDLNCVGWSWRAKTESPLEGFHGYYSRDFIYLFVYFYLYRYYFILRHMCRSLVARVLLRPFRV